MLKAWRIERIARTDETPDNEDAHGDRAAYEYKLLEEKHIGNCFSPVLCIPSRHLFFLDSFR